LEVRQRKEQDRRNHRHGLKTAVTEMGDEALKAFKEKFKINSPSKVMYDTAKGIPEGTIDAILALTPKVKEASLGMAGELYAPFADPFRPPMLRGPSLASSGGGGGGGGVMVENVIETLNVYTDRAGAPGAAAAAREGASRGMADQARATLAALETLAPA
jgi:hypothetical protein